MVELFDVDGNKNICYEELLIMFRNVINSLFMLSNHPERVTFFDVVKEMEQYKRDSQFITDEGIAPESVYKFILNSPLILEFLRRFSIFE